MKAKRRQELKTNDLAQMIEDIGQSFRQWGVYLVGAIVVVLVVVVAITYIRQAKVAAIDEAYADLRRASDFRPMGVSKSDQEIKSQLEQIGTLAERTADDNFRAEALRQRGDLSLNEAMHGGDRFNPMFLADAREAFQALLREFPDRPAYRGRALFGLFQVEADEYAADGDEQHKASAVKHLEAIRDDPAFNGTPWMKLAIDELNELDDVFAKAEFLPGAPPSPTPLPTAGATITPKKKTFTYGVDEGEFNKPNTRQAPKPDEDKGAASESDSSETPNDNQASTGGAEDESSADSDEPERSPGQDGADMDDADEDPGADRSS